MGKDASEDTNAMLAIAHKYAGGEEEGMNCLGCHEPTLAEQISEGIGWVGGSYVFPLEERDTSRLMMWKHEEGDSFCLNESCHNMTRNDLVAATADRERNPHAAVHGEVDCGACHKAHRASVNYCSQCHEDAEIPDGWLAYREASKLQGVE